MRALRYTNGIPTTPLLFLMRQAGLPGRDWPHVARAVHLAGEFAVTELFAMHFRDREMCERFVAEATADGVSAKVNCPAARGQRFVVAKRGRGR